LGPPAKCYTISSLFLDKKEDIDKTIGTCIYTGDTDSGSFRFPGTTGNTHRIVAELIDLGVENTKIPLYF
jgi:phosphoesterase RecJ-like protein